MATQPTNTPPPSGIDAWAPYLRQLAYGMLAVGAGLAILSLVLSFKNEWNNVPLLAWGLGVAVTLLLGGAVCLIPDMAAGYAPNDFLRLVLLLVLSIIGLVTSLFGLLLPFTRYREQLGGDLQTWRANSGILTLCVGAFVGGLVLMFIGLSLGRSYERTRPALRRLLYGYNAVFSSLLLALILVILNFLAYSPVWPFTYLNGQPIDWTKGGLFSLKKENKELLARVKEPVKLYIILPSQERLTQNVVELAKNCRAINPLFSWETLSPQINDPEIRKLKEKYQLGNPMGVLVVVGVEPTTKHRLIPPDDLLKFYTDRFGQPVRDASGHSQFYFTTESALMKTIQRLAFESKPVKVYFTQGDGELQLEGSKNPVLSLSRVKAQLDPASFDLKPLPFTAADATKGIPEDADMVVIPGPTERFSPEALQAFRDYMDKRNGKLIVLTGALPADRRGGMKQTGLEEFLRNYQVDVGDNRVLYARRVSALEQRGAVYSPSALRVQLNDQSSNPIVSAFKDEQKEFFFIKARTISKLESGPNPAPNALTVDELIQTIPAAGAWADKAFTEDEDALADQLRQNEKLFAATVSRKPLPLAVAVSDGKKPRMVVFGSSYFLSDALGETILADNNFELFRASLAWLVDRPELNIPVDDKPPSYTLSVSEDRFWQMTWLPGVLMLLGVITLGGGVWVVRRR